MTKKKKWLLISLGIVGVILIMLVFVGYNIYQSTFGSEELSGMQTMIPKPINDLPELIKGDNDWRNWRGPTLDGKSAITGIKKDWTRGMQKVWQVDYLCQGKQTATWSTPVIQGNRLIVPGRDEQNDLLFCLNSENGDLLWTGSYPAETGKGHGPGARATPFIDDDRIYTLGRGGDLVCWQLYDGKQIWKQNVQIAGGVEPGWGYSTSPIVYKNTVIVQGGGTAMVVAYDKIFGKTVWKSMQGPAGYAALTLMTGTNDTSLIVFQGKGLSSLNPDTGEELWSTPWETSYDVNATTPAISGMNLFMTSGYGRGSQTLRITESGFDILWEQDAFASHHSDPVIIDGYIYGYTGQSNQNKGDFVCLNLESGKEMWRTGEIGWGTTVFIDGHLLCMDIKGNLYLVKPDPASFIKVTEFKNALERKVKHPAWTVPVVANGNLYLRYLQQLTCYDLMGE
jgi:outer membrane protein assembly factor BamB